MRTRRAEVVDKELSDEPIVHIELHASRTAITALEASGLANADDRQGVKRVLRSTALTYLTGLGRQMSNFLFFVAAVGAARG